MTHQFKRFSKEYEKYNFEIFLTSAHEFDDVIEGRMFFFDSLDPAGLEVKNFKAIVNFYIFNIYNLEDILPLADSISSDLEYVASAYNIYCSEFGGMGSIAIIDEFYLTDETKGFNEKIQMIKCFLAKTIEKLQIIGTGTLLFMSKALIFSLNKSERIFLINELLDISCIPIYQDEKDVVLARNLDYSV